MRLPASEVATQSHREGIMRAAWHQNKVGGFAGRLVRPVFRPPPEILPI